MNNRREHYSTVIAYALMLVLVWLFSWLADIASVFMGSSIAIASLVSNEGVRWAMRNAIPALDSLPWGTIILAVAACGLLRGAGIVQVVMRFVRRERITRNQVRSILFSLGALAIYAATVYLLTLSHWNVIGSVTGSLANSPFMDGMPLLLFFGVLIAALVYGFMYGNYRSAADVASSLGASFSLFVPALLALVPASGVVASMGYIGMPELLGLSELESGVIASVFYAVPFLHVVLRNVLSTEN